MSEEKPTATPTSNLLDAKQLMSCFMKDFDFGSNYEEFLPNLRYEKCYLACKQKKGYFKISFEVSYQGINKYCKVVLRFHLLQEDATCMLQKM